MKTDDIKNMVKAWQEVQEKSNKPKLDKVDQGELKGTHAQRKDKDIDNDGDVDKSDSYLHNRRKTVAKAMKKGQEVETQTESAIAGTVYERILEKRDEHTKGATKPDNLKDDDTLPGKGAKEMDKDIAVTTDPKLSDLDKKGHDDAQKAGRTGPTAANDPHLRGATKGDQSVVNPVKGAVAK